MAEDLEQLVLTISADTRQMQRALDRLVKDTKKAADDVDSAFAPGPPRIDNVAKSLNKTRFETANLAAQFQDIAVQLQGGQSPFTIALQQGTQIAQVLGRGGAGGTLELLKAGFASLISPVSLATIGIIALGGAAVSYGMKAIGAVEDLDEKLKTNAALIRALKDAYGEAGKGVDTAVKEAASTLSVLVQLSTDSLRKPFKNLTQDIVTSVSNFENFGDAVGVTIETTARKFSAFKEPIDSLREGLKNGTPDILAFRRELARIAETTTDQKVRQTANELKAMTDKAAELQLQIEGNEKSLRNFSSAVMDATAQGEKFAKAMEALSKTVTPNLSDREKIIKNYSDALENAGSTEERLAAARTKNDQLAILSANERKKAAEDAAREAEGAQKRFDAMMNASLRQNAKTLGQAGALGQGDGAIARLETEYRLTEAAQQAFGKVTDEVKAKITAQAEAAGQAADALAKARVIAATEFNVRTAFLSPQDLQIAQQLAGIYGNDIPRALASSEAAGIRTAEAMRTISLTLQDVNRSIATDFVQQIRNGATAMDALRTAGTNALGRIADKLAQMAADNLWASAFGGSSGLGGLLGGLFGAGVGNYGQASNIAIGNYIMPKFAGGTRSAPGGLALVGEQGPEIVNLPRGAEVIPNHELPSMMGGGISVPISIAIDATGADAAGLARLQAELASLKADLPARVVQAVQDARKWRLLN